MEIVDLSLPHEPSADECDKSEYWLVRRTPPALFQRLAQDCDEQWGADTLGHARTRIEGGDFIVSYHEMQAGDRCEGYDARLRLSPVHVMSEARWDGLALGKTDCRKRNETTVDWERSVYGAAFTREDCSGGGRAAATYRGAAIPRVTHRGQVATMAPDAPLGSCAAIIDAAQAKNGTTGGAGRADLRIRAMVVGDSLWIEVEGGGAGVLDILSAGSAPGDGDYGGLACAPEGTRALSVLTIHLADGRVDGQGAARESVRTVARSATSTRFEAELSEAVGRLALSYRGPGNTRLDSAQLDAVPTAASLPPLFAISDEDRRCRWDSGRFEKKEDNAEADPALSLRPRD